MTTLPYMAGKLTFRVVDNRLTLTLTPTNGKPAVKRELSNSTLALDGEIGVRLKLSSGSTIDNFEAKSVVP